MEHTVPVLTAVLATVIGILLTAILVWLTRLGDKLEIISNKLDTKVSDDTCKERTTACQEVRKSEDRDHDEDSDNIWEVFNIHSHTGLAPDSKVTR